MAPKQTKKQSHKKSASQNQNPGQQPPQSQALTIQPQQQAQPQPQQQAPPQPQHQLAIKGPAQRPTNSVPSNPASHAPQRPPNPAPSHPTNRAPPQQQGPNSAFMYAQQPGYPNYAPPQPGQFAPTSYAYPAAAAGAPAAAQSPALKREPEAGSHQAPTNFSGGTSGTQIGQYPGLDQSAQLSQWATYASSLLQSNRELREQEAKLRSQVSKKDSDMKELKTYVSKLQKQAKSREERSERLTEDLLDARYENNLVRDLVKKAHSFCKNIQREVSIQTDLWKKHAISSDRMQHFLHQLEEFTYTGESEGSEYCYDKAQGSVAVVPAPTADKNAQVAAKPKAAATAQPVSNGKHQLAQSTPAKHAPMDALILSDSVKRVKKSKPASK